MNSRDFKITRRTFLHAAAPCLVVVGSRGASVRAQTPVERGEFGEGDLSWARDELLKLVNTERSAAGLNKLKLDDLACKVANAHALDMVTGDFLSHWGSDGRGPYMRYAFAGGTDAVHENVSEAEGIASVTPPKVMEDLRYMHSKMHAETPPDDGHRQAILEPTNTHVGFGIALKGHSLRLAETYLSHYMKLEPFAQEAKRKATVNIYGKLLIPGSFLHEVDVSLEPLPTPPQSDWLRTPRPFSLPQEYVRLRPKLPEGINYTDGTFGDFEWSSAGSFRVPVKLSKDSPGIYTAFFWIRRKPSEKAFPAAQVCIRAE